MEHEQWLEILSIIDADNDLNGDNVVEKIKEKLQAADLSIYEEWEKTYFDINHLFKFAYDYGDDYQALLSLAIQNGNLKLAKYLVGKGAELNVADKDGMTPLLLAAKDGEWGIIRYLVYKGAELNVADNDGRTPLLLAAKDGEWGIVQYLVKKGAELNVADKDGITPLLLAALYGKLEVVQYLVSKGAELNVANKNGRTPLLLAALYGKLEVVQYLVEKGAELNVADKDGMTPLLLAAKNAQWKVIQYLVEKGAELNVADKNGRTLLHCAILHSKLEVVRYLVDKGADFDVEDRNSMTPITYSTMYGDIEIGKFMIARKIKLKGSEAEKPNYLVQPNSDLRRKMSEHWDRCLYEVERMKKENIYGDIALYDILISEDNKLASYIRNEDIAKVLKEDGYKSKFPIHANEIEGQYKKGIERAALLDKGKESIQELVNTVDCGIQLPNEINEKIVGYLTNNEIKNLNASLEGDKENTEHLAASHAKELSSSLSDVNMENVNKATKGAQRT